jgi:hypothetical protein
VAQHERWITLQKQRFALFGSKNGDQRTGCRKTKSRVKEVTKVLAANQLLGFDDAIGMSYPPTP